MTKTISLADDAYDALAAVRLPGESFSDVARRLARRESSRFLWDPDFKVNLSAQDADRLRKQIYQERERSTAPRVKPR